MDPMDSLYEVFGYLFSTYEYQIDRVTFFVPRDVIQQTRLILFCVNIPQCPSCIIPCMPAQNSSFVASSTHPHMSNEAACL
jgi:hypothetical protein